MDGKDQTIDDALLDDIKKQFESWSNFLNTDIGILSFTLAVACLGTDVPWFNAILSLFVVGWVRVKRDEYFPPQIKDLRKYAKNNKKAAILLKGLESEFFSLRALVVDYPIFWLGFLFLSSVAISPIIVGIMPFLGVYYGI